MTPHYLHPRPLIHTKIANTADRHRHCKTIFRKLSLWVKVPRTHGSSRTSLQLSNSHCSVFSVQSTSLIHPMQSSWTVALSQPADKRHALPVPSGPTSVDTPHRRRLPARLAMGPRSECLELKSKMAPLTPALLSGLSMMFGNNLRK